VVVFPELSLTGYELDARAVAINDAALAPIVNACAATGSLALAGAPVQYEDGRDAIAVLAIGGGGASVAYRKTWLGCAEPARFRPGDGSAVLEVDGWRLGLGVGKDTGAAQHVAGTAALGVDAYLGGLVHLPQELPRAGGRAVVLAQTCRAFVVFASFARPDRRGYAATAGSSAVYSPEGIAIARAGPDCRRHRPRHPELDDANRPATQSDQMQPEAAPRSLAR